MEYCPCQLWGLQVWSTSRKNRFVPMSSDKTRLYRDFQTSTNNELIDLLRTILLVSRDLPGCFFGTEAPLQPPDNNHDTGSPKPGGLLGAA